MKWIEMKWNIDKWVRIYTVSMISHVQVALYANKFRHQIIWWWHIYNSSTQNLGDYNARCDACDKFVRCIVTNFNCMENSIPLIFTFCRLTHSLSHTHSMIRKSIERFYEIKVYTRSTVLGCACTYGWAAVTAGMGIDQIVSTIRFASA